MRSSTSWVLHFLSFSLSPFLSHSGRKFKISVNINDRILKLCMRHPWSHSLRFGENQIVCMSVSLLVGLLSYWNYTNVGISPVLDEIFFWKFLETFLGCFYTIPKWLKNFCMSVSLLVGLLPYIYWTNVGISKKKSGRGLIQNRIYPYICQISMR